MARHRSLARRRIVAALALAGSLGAPFAASIAQAQNPDPQTLRFALLPDENAATIIQNAQPLKAYLERTLKKKVDLVVTTDYSSMIEAMRFNRLEIAYFGPFSYVLAKSRAGGIEPFAVGLSRGSPTYNSIVITQVDSPIKAIGDLRGRNVGFGDQASTSSHLVPRAHIQEAGLVGDKDYKVVHLGAHDAVARAVQAGQVQAGALSKPIFESLVKSGRIDGAKLRTLAETRPIPNYPMVMAGHLNPALKDAIRKAFLDLKDADMLKNFRADGFAATDDRAYDVLRETAKILNLDLSKMQ